MTGALHLAAAGSLSAEICGGDFLDLTLEELAELLFHDRFEEDDDWGPEKNRVTVFVLRFNGPGSKAGITLHVTFRDYGLLLATQKINDQRTNPACHTSRNS